MKELKYIRVKHCHLPLDMYQKYNLDAQVSKEDYIYIWIQKGMPGLKQAAVLAYEYLKCCLLPYEYELIYGTIGL